MATPAATTEGGQAAGLSPDVCHLPAPMPPAGPGGIPTPYPNLGSLSGADKTVKKVLVRNKETLVEGSLVPSSSGDEPGCSPNPVPGPKGFASRKNMEKVEFTAHSSKVKFEGKGVIALGASTKHNGGNTVGKHVKPSQTVVSVG